MYLPYHRTWRALWRRRVRPQSVFGLLGVLALTGWLLCASSPPAAAAPNAKGPIKIAVEAPLSGQQSSTGTDILRGAQLLAAIKDHNGGVLGRQLKVIRANDDADPAKAASVAKEVIAQHPLAVIGPFDSPVGVINLPMYKAAGVIPLRLTSSHATNGLGYTVAPMDYQVAPVEAQAIAASLAPGGSVAIVYESSTFTSDIATMVRSSLASRGVPVVDFTSFSAGQQDFATLLAGVKAANPSVVYYAAYHPQASELVSQARSLGVPGTCFVDLAPEEFIQSVGVSLARTCVFSGVPDVSEFPRASGFIQDFQALYHHEPGSWAAFSYDSLGLLVHAVQQAGTWDPSRVKEALDHTVAYSGVTGDITIDPTTGNRLNAPVVILTVSRAGTYQVDPAWALYGTLVKAPRGV
jgi:branched-chain amino acid transport system substrate-binding protein